MDHNMADHNMADIELQDYQADGPHVTIDDPPETAALRPVQMREKPSGRERKAPRVSLVAREPDTPRVSMMPAKKEPTMWQKLSLHAHMQERKVHPLAWVVFGFLVLALVLVVITFGAPGWALTREIRQIDGWFEGEMHGNYGLWYACWSLLEQEEYTITSCELMVDLKNVPSWFKGVQAMGALSLFASVAAMGATCAYICSKIQNERPKVMYAAIAFCTAASICVAIEGAVFCVLFLHDAKWCCDQQAQVVEWRLQYCFYFACLALLCLWAAAISAVFEIRRLRNIAKEEQYMEKLRTARNDDFGYGMAPYRGY